MLQRSRQAEQQAGSAVGVKAGSATIIATCQPRLAILDFPLQKLSFPRMSSPEPATGSYEYNHCGDGMGCEY
jgi:hypothetical protein